jgi:hypothetical protein
MQNLWTAAAGTSDSVGNFDDVTDTPSETLEKTAGTTKASADSFVFGFLVHSTLYIQVGYKMEGHDDVSFAVSLNKRFQMFSIGKGPVWSYRSGSGGWTERGQSTAPVTLPFTVEGADIEVVITPTLDHTTGTLTVLIRNKIKK